jgi:hypothetical protein
MGIKGKNNFRDRSILFGMSELIAGGAVFIVKKFSGETRPDGSDQYSFPSGHTAAAFAAAEFSDRSTRMFHHGMELPVTPWQPTGYLGCT